MTQKSAQTQSADNTISRYPVITVDGPSGAGKGTLCMRLADALGYQLLDSGALYRIVGLSAHQQGLIVDNLDEERIATLTRNLDIRFKSESVDDDSVMRIVVDGDEVGQKIRNETVGAYASKVAALPKVRSALLALQQDMAKRSGLIADGRDMGTVVFPDADAKIYLTASATARAERRVTQLHNANELADHGDILATIKARDDRDENRDISPSRPADAALIIDSSDMNADEVYALAKQHCQNCGISFSK